MAMKVYRSRVHFLAAKEAPVVVVLMRKRSRLFHVLSIDARTDEVQEGSWFQGKLYPKRCDVSFDGKYMVYFATGDRGQVWNGVCRLPWLKTVIEEDDSSTYHGGGCFESRKVLKANCWGARRKELRIHTKSSVPFGVLGSPNDRGSGGDLAAAREGRLPAARRQLGEGGAGNVAGRGR